MSNVDNSLIAPSSVGTVPTNILLPECTVVNISKQSHDRMRSDQHPCIISKAQTAILTKRYH